MGKKKGGGKGGGGGRGGGGGGGAGEGSQGQQQQQPQQPRQQQQPQQPRQQQLPQQPPQQVQYTQPPPQQRQQVQYTQPPPQQRQQEQRGGPPPGFAPPTADFPSLGRGGGQDFPSLGGGERGGRGFHDPEGGRGFGRGRGRGEGRGGGGGSGDAFQRPPAEAARGGGDHAFQGHRGGGARGRGRGQGPPAQQPQEYSVPPPMQTQAPPPQQARPPPQQQQARPPPQQQARPPPQQLIKEYSGPPPMQTQAPPPQQARPPPQQQQARPPPQQQARPPPQQLIKEYSGPPPMQTQAPPPQQARPPPQQQQARPPPQQQARPPPQQQQARPSQASPAGDVTAAMAQMSLAPSSGAPFIGKKSTGLWKIPERKIRCDKNMMVGVRGRPIEIEVNHLLLTLKKTGLAIHYDVDFKPDVPKKMLRPAMEEMRKRYFPSRYPAFDGRKNLYSYSDLPFGDQIRDTVSVADDERDKPKDFDVTIKRVSSVDLGQIAAYLSNGTGFPQDAIQALDIALRNPAAMRFTPVGRSYFTPPKGQVVQLGNGLELWYGFYQSAILGWRPFLNVDVAHKGFPEAKSLLEVMLTMKDKSKRWNDPPSTMEQLQGKNALQRYELDDFVKFIRGLKCEFMLPNQPNTRRVYKMNGCKAPCSEYRFKLDNGTQMTVGEYFEREKRYKLRFPHLPCIWVGPDNRDICLPPELCRIMPGQVTNRKMDEVQTANMVKAAARPADERKRKIMEAMKSAGFNNDPCINEFGISVAQEFHKIKGRVLDAPALEYGNNRKVRSRAGVWRAEQFMQPMNLDRWVVLTLCSRGDERQLRDFAKTMNQQGRQLGMNINEPFKYVVLAKQENIGRANGDQLKRIILPHFKDYKTQGAQLVVVVIPERPPDCYSKVKLAAEVDIGLLTQCIKERTFGRMNPATAGNILLKINAKLNGINHTVDRVSCPVIMKEPTMLVGADVTHPSPDQTTIPSVAAVAASHDPKAFMYNMVWRLQPPRMEIIQDLESIMKAQLKFFYDKTRQKPRKIIFYRDGVSEGQFSQVLEAEMTAIRRACTSLNADYKPAVTFLVVQKRHHTRFFPTRKEDEDGKNKNVPPGTIVDTWITHPKEMDFYLVSHASLQGTSRPTKYHKLWDDNDIGEDDLEELTYYLCHLFSRCTRSVSYPAPTYYAHLAAARGRVYLEGAGINLTNLQQEMNTRKIQEVIVQNSPMFFV